MGYGYPGFCAKYGQNKVMLVGYAAPPLIALAFNAAAAHAGSACRIDASIAFAAGTLGFLSGTISHIFTNAALSARHIGLTEGGRIVRKVQAAAYTLPVLGGLFLGNLVSSAQKTNPDHGKKENGISLQHKSTGAARTPAPETKPFP